MEAREHASAATSRTVRIVVADPHDGMRKGLHMLLDRRSQLKIVATSADLDGALRAVAPAGACDVVLVDAQLAGLGTPEARAGLAELARRAPVVVMGMADPSQYRDAIMAKGAAGYWPKYGDLGWLLELLDTVARPDHRSLRLV